MSTVLAVGATASLLVLVPIGLYERARHAELQNEGIARVHAAVGGLEGEEPIGFRFLDAFQCIVYERDGQRFALELCVDWEGRVVEAIDRRGKNLEIWSLREDPARAHVRVDRRRFERMIEAMCAPCGSIFERARMPHGRAP